MRFETLAVGHLDSLLKFELENRAWFETQIAPRGNDFYNCLGVKTHINESIVNAKLGNSYSAVLIENGEIRARANLKNICAKQNCAFVGYRVAYKNTGKGLATLCLSELIREAQRSYKIKELRAQVLSNNPASISVLKKKEFKETNYQEDFLELNGEKLGCTTYSRISA